MANVMCELRQHFPNTVIEIQRDPTCATKEKVTGAYDTFAGHYDKTVTAGKYNAPNSVTKTFVEQAKKLYPGKNKELKIMDVGCGTGLVAELLAPFDYTNMDGLDASQSMLDEAEKKKGLYQNLMCVFLTSDRVERVPDNTYDALVSAGSFLPGHIKADTFDEILRWMKKGSILCFSCREDGYIDPEQGYKTKFDELERENKWKLLSVTKEENFANEDANQFSNRYIYVFTYLVL